MGNKERDEENDGTPLPVVAKDDELLCEKGEVVERQTQPPRHFTDATLLSAMTGIARFVQDKDLKKDPASDRRTGNRSDARGHYRTAVQARIPDQERALHSFNGCRESPDSLVTGDGCPTGYDGALGVCPDANQ